MIISRSRILPGISESRDNLPRPIPIVGTRIWKLFIFPFFSMVFWWIFLFFPFFLSVNETPVMIWNSKSRIWLVGSSLINKFLVGSAKSFIFLIFSIYRSIFPERLREEFFKIHWGLIKGDLCTKYFVHNKDRSVFLGFLIFYFDFVKVIRLFLILYCLKYSCLDFLWSLHYGVALFSRGGLLSFILGSILWEYLISF